MTTARSSEPLPRKPLRVWPGILAVAVQWAFWFIIPVFLPETGPYGIFVGLLAGLTVVLWWLLLSRAPWLERIGIVVLMILAIVLTKQIVHKSIAGGGMGFILFIYAVPFLSLALVAAAAASRKLPAGSRRATFIGAILLACGAFTLIRTGGITGEGDSDIHWRWSKTPEEVLLAQAASKVTVQTPPAGADAGPTWPGFRGQHRDSVVRGVRIETDWSKSPPVELWRRPIGPGWSSFAVQGGVFYTQEQRGENELVSCYGVAGGEPVWTHSDATRFWESNAGAGPRATPTLHEARLYTFGGTGVLNALDAATGAVIWSRNAAADTGGKLPHWGFASSPLVADDLVVVDAGGLAAYDRATGQPRWIGKAAGGSYSSPHLATIGGVPQVLLLKGGRAISVAVADGALLWQHEWQSGVASIVQPALLVSEAQNDPAGATDVLITAADEMGGIGMRRISVARNATAARGAGTPTTQVAAISGAARDTPVVRELATPGDPPGSKDPAGVPAAAESASGPSGWTITERWTTRGLKPYYNDFVVHKSHAYGFDNSILSCIDLSDGARKWKRGRFGHGQLILLADQDLLLVLSEHGELALVFATPDEFQEVARFPVLEGKTWNHPVLVGDTLLVRNDQEMAAFRLPLPVR